jgi:hypothetical protein
MTTGVEILYGQFHGLTAIQTRRLVGNPQNVCEPEPSKPSAFLTTVNSLLGHLRAQGCYAV